MPLKSVLLALFAVTIIGLSFPVTKMALADLPPLLLAAVRFTLVSVSLVFFCPFPKTSIANVIGIGFFQEFLALGFVYYALKSDIQSGVASLLVQSQVLFTLLLCALLFHDRLNRQQFLGLLIAIAGFAIFFYYADKGGSTTAKGLFLVLAAGLSWAVANILFRRIKPDVNLLHLLVWASLVPPIPMLLLSLVYESHTPWVFFTHLKGITWFSIFYQAFLVTLIGYVLWGGLIRRYPSALVAPFALLVPVVGMLGSSVILNESLTYAEWFASLLVLLGVALCVVKFGGRSPAETSVEAGER
ncbi:EamA family transporter [Microbulbifer sp. SSSA002]|uniref:EamA family transporter n=1 Tax=unclassified Microbulbifer TaxID=2619833 RepID=UPI00403A072E